MRLSKARKACVEAMMKDTIFDAAGSVLAERGADGLTMDRVATKVGVAKASLYNYFKDKNELLRYTYNRMVEPFFQAVEEVARADIPAAQKLTQDYPGGFGVRPQAHGAHELVTRMGYEPEIKKACRPRFVKILTAVFKQGIKEGSFLLLDARDLSHMFLGCLLELFDLQASGRQRAMSSGSPTP